MSESEKTSFVNFKVCDILCDLQNNSLWKFGTELNNMTALTKQVTHAPYMIKFICLHFEVAESCNKSN